MRKCKWAGDPADEYCKSCDGCKMIVDNVETECTNCAGYEAGEEEVETTNLENVKDTAEPIMDEPVTSTKNDEKTDEKTAKPKKTNNNTSTAKAKKIEDKNKATTDKSDVVKVSEEKHKEEESEYTPTGIKVTSLRYTSGATIKKGDNYFKFIAEEEWDVSQAKQDIQDVREQLWAKLNSEVDSQIEELNNMN